jgi:hypothetical protein
MYVFAGYLAQCTAPFTFKKRYLAFFLKRTVSELFFVGAIVDEALKKKNPRIIPSKVKFIGDIGAYSVDRQTSWLYSNFL